MRHPKMIFAVACLIALGLTAVFAPASAPQPSAAAAPNLRPPSERFASLQATEDPSFRRHVIPLLARAGCSGRECHGSFQGRGGLQLSLFGSDWVHDHSQLTQEKGDEDEIRVDLKQPDQSLMLLKPTVQVKHKGKERIKKDSWEYNLVLKWIRAGAKNDADQTGELQRMEITPSEIVFNRVGQTVQLRVVAHWADGVVEDVTQITRFKTNDETIAVVSDTGMITCTGKGDSHIVASYDNGVLPIPVMLPVSEFAGANFPSSTPRTHVDELVLAKLQKVGIVPSGICSDGEFLRRVTLDVTGTLPTPDEVTRFLADPSPGKRAAKIEELLKTPAYAAWWTTKLCDYTGNSPRTLNNGNINRNPGELSRQWYQWIYKRVAANTPYDRLCADIVLATSRSSPQQSYKDYSLETSSYFRADHPADYSDHPTLAYFWQRRTVALPQEKALAFSHTFLGLRLECAQCHKHPFDQWTKRDFEQFTAFFAPVGYNQGPRVPGAPGGKGMKGVAVAPTTAPAGPVQISYQSVNKEIQDKVKLQMDAQTPDPKKAQGLQQKLLNAEIARRIDAGELVPWSEVWVDSRPQFAKNQPAPVKGKQGAPAPITPKLLGGEQVALAAYPDPRKPLMDWLRSKSNPYFARAFVNRVWASYFNRGIVDPPDDLNRANAPANAELLNYLAEGFIEHSFDMKWLHREILNSDAYQRSWKTNATNHLDARNFSHAVVRQLPAEVMLDAINMAIASEKVMLGFPAATDERAIGPGGSATYTKGKAQQGGDGYFLNVFGRPTRETNCDCERSADPTLLQTLYTRNDPNLLGRIDGGASWIAELRKTGAKGLNVDNVIKQTFLRTVSRPPTEQEMTEARADIAAAKTPIDGVRDLLWTMINTREFKVNH